MKKTIISFIILLSICFIGNADVLAEKNCIYNYSLGTRDDRTSGLNSIKVTINDNKETIVNINGNSENILKKNIINYNGNEFTFYIDNRSGVLISEGKDCPSVIYYDMNGFFSVANNCPINTANGTMTNEGDAFGYVCYSSTNNTQEARDPSGNKVNCQKSSNICKTHDVDFTVFNNKKVTLELGYTSSGNKYFCASIQGTNDWICDEDSSDDFKVNINNVDFIIESCSINKIWGNDINTNLLGQKSTPTSGSASGTTSVYFTLNGDTECINKGEHSLTNNWVDCSNFTTNKTCPAASGCTWKDNKCVLKTYEFGNICEMFSDEIRDDIKTIFKIFRIVAPLLVLGLSTFDYVSAVVSKDGEKLKSSNSKMIKRLILIAILFFLPNIINLILKLVLDDYQNCNLF